MQTGVKSLEPLNRRPYELLKWGTNGLFLQCCATKIHHAPEATELLFRESRKRLSPKFASFAFSEVRAQKKGRGPSKPRPGESWLHPTRRHSSSAYDKPRRNSANAPAPEPTNAKADTKASGQGSEGPPAVASAVGLALAVALGLAVALVVE